MANEDDKRKALQKGLTDLCRQGAGKVRAKTSDGKSLSVRLRRESKSRTKISFEESRIGYSKLVSTLGTIASLLEPLNVSEFNVEVYDKSGKLVYETCFDIRNSEREEAKEELKDAAEYFESDGTYTIKVNAAA